MNPEPQSRRRLVLRSISAAVSLLLVIVGGLVVAGWAFDIRLLKSLSPNWVTMKVNTATCFILAGFSLWWLRDEEAPVRLRRLG